MKQPLRSAVKAFASGKFSAIAQKDLPESVSALVGYRPNEGPMSRPLGHAKNGQRPKTVRN